MDATKTFAPVPMASIPKAARVAGISVPRARKAFANGDLPGAVKIGGHYMVNLEILSKHLQGVFR